MGLGRDFGANTHGAVRCGPVRGMADISGPEQLVAHVPLLQLECRGSILRFSRPRACREFPPEFTVVSGCDTSHLPQKLP